MAKFRYVRTFLFLIVALLIPSVFAQNPDEQLPEEFKFAVEIFSQPWPEYTYSMLYFFVLMIVLFVFLIYFALEKAKIFDNKTINAAIAFVVCLIAIKFLPFAYYFILTFVIIVGAAIMGLITGIRFFLAPFGISTKQDLLKTSGGLFLIGIILIGVGVLVGIISSAMGHFTGIEWVQIGAFIGAAVVFLIAILGVLKGATQPLGFAAPSLASVAKLPQAYDVLKKEIDYDLIRLAEELRNSLKILENYDAEYDPQQKQLKHYLTNMQNTLNKIKEVFPKIKKEALAQLPDLKNLNVIDAETANKLNKAIQNIPKQIQKPIKLIESFNKAKLTNVPDINNAVKKISKETLPFMKSLYDFITFFPSQQIFYSKLRAFQTKLSRQNLETLKKELITLSKKLSKYNPAKDKKRKKISKLLGNILNVMKEIWIIARKQNVQLRNPTKFTNIQNYFSIALTSVGTMNDQALENAKQLLIRYIINAVQNWI
ncbi:MAG: hypothetical protein QW625_01555 [Candidatus Nanoarchaeia archaeon]